jgi:hypothetical protein
MTWLRQRMLEAMQLRERAPRTQESYLAAVRQLAIPYGRSPDQRSEDELRQYFLYLRNEKRVAPTTAHVALNAVRFLYVQTLQRPWPLGDLMRRPKARHRPVVLTPAAVATVIAQIRRPPSRVCLRIISACGLRLLEGGQLHVPQIDSARMLLRIQAGKGNTDRYVPVPPRALMRLRDQWRTHRNPVWRFPSPGPTHDQYATASVPSLLFRAAAAGLQPLAHDPRFLGGQIGMLGVLQTWTRDLRFHPPVDYPVPALGVAADGTVYRPRNPAFLVPVKAVASLFRAKLRAALRQTDLYAQGAPEMWRQAWVVDCRAVGSRARAEVSCARHLSGRAQQQEARKSARRSCDRSLSRREDQADL